MGRLTIKIGGKIYMRHMGTRKMTLRVPLGKIWTSSFLRTLVGIRACDSRDLTQLKISSGFWKFPHEKIKTENDLTKTWYITYLNFHEQRFQPHCQYYHGLQWQCLAKHFTGDLDHPLHHH